MQSAKKIKIYIKGLFKILLSQIKCLKSLYLENQNKSANNFLNYISLSLVFQYSKRITEKFKIKQCLRCTQLIFHQQLSLKKNNHKIIQKIHQKQKNHGQMNNYCKNKNNCQIINLLKILSRYLWVVTQIYMIHKPQLHLKRKSFTNNTLKRKSFTNKNLRKNKYERNEIYKFIQQFVYYLCIATIQIIKPNQDLYWLPLFIKIKPLDLNHHSNLFNKQPQEKYKKYKGKNTNQIKIQCHQQISMCKPFIKLSLKFKLLPKEDQKNTQKISKMSQNKQMSQLIDLSIDYRIKEQMVLVIDLKTEIFELSSSTFNLIVYLINFKSTFIIYSSVLILMKMNILTLLLLLAMSRPSLITTDSNPNSKEDNNPSKLIPTARTPSKNEDLFLTTTNLPLYLTENVLGDLYLQGDITAPVTIQSNITGSIFIYGTVKAPLVLQGQVGNQVIIRGKISAPVSIQNNVQQSANIVGTVDAPITVQSTVTPFTQIQSTVNGPISISGSSDLWLKSGPANTPIAVNNESNLIESTLFLNKTPQ